MCVLFLKRVFCLFHVLQKHLFVFTLLLRSKNIFNERQALAFSVFLLEKFYVVLAEMVRAAAPRQTQNLFRLSFETGELKKQRIKIQKFFTLRT